ncbi:MAG TPA: glycosyltransferase family 4 protein [Chthoniobacterales bacterium]|nr:glycosyltransferase family 4 protein [Chthoniobacterales bacterium]
MKALLAHPGTQYSGQLARQLHRHDCLLRFWTSFGLVENGLIDRAIRGAMPTPPDWLGHRTVTGVPIDKIRTIPWLEFAALLRLRLGGEPQVVMHWRNERFQRAIAQADIEESDAVIGFDTSANILADRAAGLGRPLILDQTIAHPRSKHRVYEAIKAQYPDWADDLDIRPDTIGAAEESEHRKAAKIVVASSFTKRTLVENGIAENKIILNPYGVDLKRFSIRHQESRIRPFRFLFAGLVCARKGIPLLLQAWQRLKRSDAELCIVGPLTPTAAAKCRSDGNVNVLGKLPHTSVASMMSESDVFVFPSYFEGFGLVLLEAMAAGLPVITTTATAAPDIITDGSDGFIIKSGDADALATKMEFCLGNRERVAEMGLGARAKAERFSWDAYGDRWTKILQEINRG